MTEELPNNEALEKNVIGAILIDPDAYFRVRPVVGPNDFFIERHAWIYRAIERLLKDNHDVDFSTVMDELERQGRLKEVGGAEFIAGLVNNTPTSMHAETYAARVREAAVKRRLVLAAQKIAIAAHDNGVNAEDAFRTAYNAVMESEAGKNGRGASMAELAGVIFDDFDEWSRNPLADGETRFLSTGIRALDNATNGMRPGLYMVAARPSMGKTALCLQIAGNIAARGERVLFFTLEMSPRQLGMRVATARAGVPSRTMERGTASSEEMQVIMAELGEMSKMPMRVERATTTAEIRSIIQREQMSGDVAAVFVDGFWLLAGEKRPENRNLELGSHSRALKLAADDLGVPIAIVHQLSRGVEQRKNKRPILSDLRESGRLEEDIDICWMLYRDGYYEPESLTANVFEIWIRKDRLGDSAGKAIELYWNEKYARCDPLQREPLDF